MKIFKKKKAIISILFIMAFIFLSAVFTQNIIVMLQPYTNRLQETIVSYKTKDFITYETEHYLIKYENGTEEYIDLVEKASEKYFDEVCSNFNYSPKGKILLIVYADPDKLMSNVYLSNSKPPMGVYYASTIQILSPDLWISDEENIEEIFMKKGPIVHELTHYVVDDIANGNYPLWFTEGIALYQEYKINQYEWGTKLDQDKRYSIEQLEQFKDLDIVLAYRSSFEIIEKIVEQKDFEYINNMLEYLGTGNSFNNIELTY